MESSYSRSCTRKQGEKNMVKSSLKTKKDSVSFVVPWFSNLQLCQWCSVWRQYLVYRRVSPTSPISRGRAPMAFCSALISSLGPTIRDVPVSTIAWQLALQRVSWLPTPTLQGLERGSSGAGQRHKRHQFRDFLSCYYNPAFETKKTHI